MICSERVQGNRVQVLVLACCFSHQQQHAGCHGHVDLTCSRGNGL